MTDELLVAREGGILRLTLHRPARRNAMTLEIVAGMLEALDDAARDDDMRAVLIDASGDHFCSGFDFGRMARPEQPPRRTELHRRIDDTAHRLLERITTIELPVVTAVRGHAAAFGLGLALVGDFIVADETAKFTAPFVKRGFTADSGTSYLLPRAIGLPRAKEMLMLGRTASAQEALDWGLISRLVPDGELDAQAGALAEELAAAATTAVGLTKWLLCHNADVDFGQGLRLESLVEDISTRTADGKEGVKAFMEKRAPQFGGR